MRNRLSSNTTFLGERDQPPIQNRYTDKNSDFPWKTMKNIMCGQDLIDFQKSSSATGVPNHEASSVVTCSDSSVGAVRKKSVILIS